MKLEQFVVHHTEHAETLTLTPYHYGFSIDMESDQTDDYRYIEMALTHDEALTLILFLAQHIDHDRLKGDDS